MKDAYYFPHDANARNDPKILAMRSIYGAAGYGWFWIIVEMLREQETYRLPLDKYTGNALAMQMQCTPDEARRFIDDCINEFHLFTSDGKFFWSDSLCRRMEKYDEKAAKARQAALARWGKEGRTQGEDGEAGRGERMQCKRNADAVQTQCGGNASKVKESKVQESTRTDQGTSSQKKASTRKSVLVGGGTRKGAATNPDVKTFIDYYHDRFLSRFGEKPVIDGGKDGAIVKRLLSTYGLEKLKGLLDDFLAEDNPWLRERGYTLGMFKSQINALIGKRRRRYGDEPDPDQQAAIESTMPEELRRAINGA